MKPQTFTWKKLTADELTRVYLDEMRRDFPPSELKPLSMILNSEAVGMAHTWGVFEGETMVSYLLMAPVNDGGQWDMLCNLIEKYGVVPKTAYPESKASSGSREMDMTLTEKLREDACILRKLHKEGKNLDELRAHKTRMLGEIYRLLCICLGEPPKTFTFE